MRLWGKLLGAVIGFAVAGPLGALIGVVVGHALDRWRDSEAKARRLRHATGFRQQRSRSGGSLGSQGGQAPEAVFSDPAETRRIAFATAVIVLGAKLAKVDGVVSQDEVRAFKRIFQVDDRDVGDVGRIYNQAKRSAHGFEPYARQIAGLFGREPGVLEELLVGFFEIARADGELNPAEVDFLRRVAGIFGFEANHFEQIRARYAATNRRMDKEDDAYAVLGLTRSASDDEIKRTYRRLVREHHPDTLVAKGLPKEFLDQANRTLAAINAAYDRIEKERGLK